MATAFEELSATALQVAGNANAAWQRADEAGHGGPGGKSVVAQTGGHVQTDDGVSDAKPVVEHLSANSDNINDIPVVIQGSPSRPTCWP